MQSCLRQYSSFFSYEIMVEIRRTDLNMIENKIHLEVLVYIIHRNLSVLSSVHLKDIGPFGGHIEINVLYCFQYICSMF